MIPMPLKLLFTVALVAVLFHTACSDKEEPLPVEFEYGIISSSVNGVSYVFGLTKHTYNTTSMVEVKGDSRLKIELLLPNDGNDLLSLKAGTYGINHSAADQTSPVLLEITYNDPSHAEALTLRADPQTKGYYHVVESIAYKGKKQVTEGKGSYQYDMFEIKGRFRGRLSNSKGTVEKDITASYKVLYAANPL